MSSPSPAPAKTSGPPLFSFVVAAYNIDRYLPEFIKSIESQSTILERTEVIVVDDGSTDNTLATLKEWQRRRPELVTVLSKSNGGQSSARNLGLDHATGEWVTFTDPDDVIEPNYLASVQRFLAANPDADMIATRRLLLNDATGEVHDNHPLDHLFGGRDHLVDLEECPEYFHGSVSAGFLRRDEIERQNLRFDVNVRPNFEDGHYCCLYLLALDSPKVGFVSSARYRYRKRADNSSTVQTAGMDPDRFTKAPRHGYLDALERGAEAFGTPPGWLQNFVVYELSHYFTQEMKSGSAATAAHGEVAAEFLAILGSIAAHLDPQIVNGFSHRPLSMVCRDVLVNGFANRPWTTPYVVVCSHDSEAGLQQIRYRFVGERPQERITVDGIEFHPEHHKVLAHDFWEQSLLYERIAWVPARGDLRVYINGDRSPLRTTYRGREPLVLNRGRKGGSSRSSSSLTLRARAVRKLSVQKAVRKKFGDAWVLVDRLHAGDDNAERLFRYLRDEHPDVNAWFVLEKGTPDWSRLVEDGYRRRLVAYGSLKWKLLLLNCRHLISSHADEPIVAPKAVTRYRTPEWRFSFLQHGVIKDDISRWLNNKQIDLFVTSTPAEHESIVGDGSPYKFTSREVKMTGMPRFDRLRALGREYPPERRDLVLVCPTWRDWLSRPSGDGGQRRDVVDDFFESNWVRNWMEVLHHDDLRTLADRHGVDIGFLPHANMQSVLSEFDLPDHVKPLSFAGSDVQRLMARSIAFVTDYSSMAFNAAYLDRPVVYFQFDAAEVMGGGHTGRQSYFDYKRDGFGPVCQDPVATVQALQDVVELRGEIGIEYQRRVNATFPVRDGHCSERTYKAIEGLR